MTLSQQQRKLAALAAAIHADLAQPKAPSVRPALPEVPWQSCRHQLRLLELAQRRGYHATAIELQEDLRQSLVGLEATISQIRGQLPARQPPRLCSPHEIYGDLRGLYDEFPEVGWSKKQGNLSVTTEPIELESRYLGPFKIELYWRGSGGHASYSVLALDPQPASGSSDVTHPHVQGEQLCEGEGTTADSRGACAMVGCSTSS